jgi:hypothetical protein
MLTNVLVQHLDDLLSLIPVGRGMQRDHQSGIPAHDQIATIVSKFDVEGLWLIHEFEHGASLVIVNPGLATKKAP